MVDQINHNFKSVIALGNFNPAILTPDFLLRHCNLALAPAAKIQATPIITQIISGPFKIVALLEQFQIFHNGITDLNDPTVVNIAKQYFNTLKFTPIAKIGVNFNSTVKNSKIDKGLSLFRENKVKNLHSIKIDEYIFQEQVHFLPTNAVMPNFFNVTFSRETNSVNRLRVEQNGADAIVNYNFEVNNLASADSSVNKILDMGKTLISEHSQFIQEMFE